MGCCIVKVGHARVGYVLGNLGEVNANLRDLRADGKWKFSLCVQMEAYLGSMSWIGVRYTDDEFM